MFFNGAIPNDYFFQLFLSDLLKNIIPHRKVVLNIIFFSDEVDEYILITVSRNSSDIIF